MKTIKILIFSILIVGITYFYLDRHLFFYGKNDFNFYNRLPLNIKPEFSYDFEGGFTLFDEYGFSIISRSSSYETKNEKIKIKEILGYGFSQDNLIAKISDSIGRTFFIECEKNTDKTSKREMIASVIDPTEKIDFNKYKWIQLQDNSRIGKIELARNWLMFIIVGLFVTLFIKILKKRNNYRQQTL